jgi:hypothetical protein
MNLFHLVGKRNRDQNRFVESAADEFNLSAASQLRDLRQIFRMRGDEPLKQRPGIVQTDANSRMPRQAFHKGEIRLAIGALENPVKIADGLMRVNQENEMELRHANTTLWILLG